MLEKLAEVGRAVLAQLPLVAVGVLVIALFYAVGRLIRRGVRQALRRRDPAFVEMVARLAFVATTILGVFLALWIAIPAVNFAEILASLGVTGLILGFALKDIIENFIAGILILWRRPFKVGDQVRSGSYEGTVREINFRSTVLRTYDGIKVFIPNGKIFTEPLENLTGYSERRVRVDLGIDLNASVAQARTVVLAALRETDGVLAEPPPVVLFDAVGDFTMNLHVLFWTAPPTRFAELTTKSEVTERLYMALQEAGIGFPYPIQTVQLLPQGSKPDARSWDSRNGAKADRTSGR